MTSRVRQKRARGILAGGAGFVLSAAIAPSYILSNREPCWGSDQRKGAGPLKVAAVFGSVGLVALVGGVSWLAHESRRHGHYSSRRERAVAAAKGTLTFVLSQGVLGAVFFADQLCHT